MSWLWNVMQPKVSKNFMFLGMAKEIWETISQTYSKVKDATVIFEVKIKINSTRQSQSTITEYYDKMKELSLELDQYQAIKMVCSEDVATLNQIFERDRIVEFLAGLNPKFDQVQIQVLGRDKLSTLNEVFAIVRSEENRKGAMLSEHNIESSAIISSDKEGAGGKVWKAAAQTKISGHEGQWCTYCKKPRHTRETCFKLHGKEAI